jgi:hypothetical protein
MIAWSLLDFGENDSGEVAAATRDAERADRYLRRGASWSRAAGQALGVQIGELNGYGSPPLDGCR